MSFLKNLFGKKKEEEKEVEAVGPIVNKEDKVEAEAPVVQQEETKIPASVVDVEQKETIVESPVEAAEEPVAPPAVEVPIEVVPPPPIQETPRPTPVVTTADKKAELNKGLEKTKTGFFSKITKAIAGKSTVDVEVLDELENVLITSDVGLDTTVKIIDRIEARVAKDKYINTAELNEILRDEIVQLLAENNNVEEATSFAPPVTKKPYVMMVVGVNGVGKTTTIGKLAYQFQQLGLKVVMGAGDTYRAAAVDQLKIWADRVGCDFFSKGMHTDPAAVAYETVQYAINNDCDVAIIDTAGRLHTKINLMKELTKIKKSMDKKMEGTPHDVMLVLDATTGQNAIEQAKHFTNATEVTCLALTKLDGTAKGGVAIGISDQFKIPIKYLGIGEGIQQLQVFNKREFVDSFFKKVEG